MECSTVDQVPVAIPEGAILADMLLRITQSTPTLTRKLYRSVDGDDDVAVYLDP